MNIHLGESFFKMLHNLSLFPFFYFAAVSIYIYFGKYPQTLDSKRKLLHEAIVKQRATLVNLYEERKSLELLLERTGQLYRQAHLERRQLVNTWKDAVTQMNQREKEIKDTETEFDNAKKISGEKIAALKREEAVMELKQRENREIELCINELNITTSDLRNHLLKLDDMVILKDSEVISLRFIVCKIVLFNVKLFSF